MSSWLMAAVLCGCCGDEPELNAPQAAAAVAQEMAPELTTGTLLGTRGDCLAVRIYTRSSMTHVGSVVIDSDGPWVYESTSGIGVRKLPLRDYLARQAPNRVLVYRPQRDLSQDQSRAYRAYLESQLGREYSVKHHISGDRCEGIHCAEYATEALLRTKLIAVKNPVRVSPASLIEGVTENGLYVEERVWEVESGESVEPDRKNMGRCRRLWEETRDCWNSSSKRLKGWFLCR